MTFIAGGSSAAHSDHGSSKEGKSDKSESAFSSIKKPFASTPYFKSQKKMFNKRRRFLYPEAFEDILGTKIPSNYMPYIDPSIKLDDVIIGHLNSQGY